MKSVTLKIFQAAVAQFGDSVLRHRLILVIAVQLTLIAAANLTAFALRFDGEFPQPYGMLVLKGLPLVVVIFGASLWAFGIVQGLWRYVGLHDLGRILWASIAGSMILYVVFHGLLSWTHYPRSIIILTGLLSSLYLAGIRLAVRWFREWIRIVGPMARRVLIVGAGNAGELLVRNMLTDSEYNYRPVAFVDDDPVKQKARIHGIPVAGAIAEIKKIAESTVAHEIIVAIPSASTSLKQKILVASEGCTVPIKVLPSVKRLLDDPAWLQRVRPMSLEDLLQREPIQTDRQELHPLLEGKRVLVTGAGGSIGSELCRQIAHYHPACLVLFERYENSLHALDLELRRMYPQVTVLPVIGDITNPDRVADVFKATTPHLVFHAAAHKHVPLMEQNPGEAVRNNVFGTKVVGEAALHARVEQFVLISTDKAINPSSVMGATKRVAEFLMHDLNRHGTTKFTTVRFGNVLGSNGSVVPLFADQIRKGGPITVTHPDIKRYFMTIPEAVQLVLQASVMGQGGEVFVLNMGEQIRVVDLARNMIVLSGLVPDKDIKVIYTGLRPGEKLYEELFEQTEHVQPTAHPKINRAIGAAPFDSSEFERVLKELEIALQYQEEDRIVRQLRTLVASYNPASIPLTVP